jgi:hypothetical protein
MNPSDKYEQIKDIKHLNPVELEAMVLNHEQQIKDLAAHLLELKRLVTPTMEFKPEKSLPEPVLWNGTATDGVLTVTGEFVSRRAYEHVRAILRARLVAAEARAERWEAEADKQFQYAGRVLEQAAAAEAQCKELRDTVEGGMLVALTLSDRIKELERRDAETKQSATEKGQRPA